jgi:hypothetical protein
VAGRFRRFFAGLKIFLFRAVCFLGIRSFQKGDLNALFGSFIRLRALSYTYSDARSEIKRNLLSPLL